MRIRSRSTQQGATIGANDACTLFGSGETEDYTIDIQAPPTIPPVAAFTASNDTVAIGQSLNFFDASANLPNGWNWTFTGAATTTSTAQNPTGITYNTLGCYPVQLIASNNYGSDTVIATCYVTVIIPPYCTVLYTANCSAADNINSVVVANTTLNNTNTGCNGTTATPGYHLFPDSANTTATMHAGTTYQISVTTASARSCAVWIDYNQNGTFETTEYTFVSAATTANVATTANINIPSNALFGQTRMRVRTRSTNAGLPATDACVVGGSGETEDYVITIDAAPLLSPVAAFTADSTTIYFGQNVDFTDNSSNLPTSWLWSFPGGTPSTSTAQNPQNIVYPTNGCYPVTLIASNQYGSDTITTTCYITVTDPPYCANIQTNNCGGGNGGGSINTVSITGTNFNNANTGCVGTPYTIYPVANNTSAILNRGDVYNINVTTTASQRVGIWIDFNHNFVFESSEFTLVANATLANFPAGIAITIPQSAVVGTTGMRVRCRSTQGTLTAADACTQFGSGETEDYTVTIGAGGNNPPVADFTADFVSISPFGSVNFSDLSANNPTSWSWSFPGASPSSSTSQNPTGIIYGTPGCYDVTLIASNAFGSDTITMPCYINVTTASTYCVPTHSAACTNSYIKTVQITGTTLNNNNTSCDNITAQGYTIWPATGNKTGQLNRNQSYTLKVTCNVGSRISVWIDYNHNNVFETTEWTQVATGSQANLASSVTIFVPATAVAGPTGMRIRSITTPAGGPGGNATNGATNSCSTFATGESEDYTITIFDPTLIPVANFTANTTTVCVGESVTFTDASTNTPSVWNWTVPGTATGTATGQSPTVTYTTPGVYPVTLIAINGNGSDTITMNNYITVNAGPALNAGSNVAICAGSSTQLSATGSSNYSWSPSTGLSASNVANPTANPSQTTTYIVTSSGSGCTAHDTVVVTVNPIPTHVLSNLPAITQCDGTVTLDAGNAGSTYLWNDANASTTQTITVSASQNYHVITTNSFGCSITDSRNVTINATPVVNLGAPVTQCGGTVTLNAGNAGATYLWSNNATTQSTTVSATGTYSVVVNNNGCTASGSTSVTINSASVNVGSNATICLGSTTNLNATGTGTFSWSPSTGLSDPNIANPIAAPTTTTAYTVTITNNGCTATATQTVTVNPVGTNASAGSDVSICRTASTQLQATGGTSYAWSPATGLSASNIANPTANPIATTTYSVVVTNAGCSATKTVTVTVVGENATAGLDLTVCPGNTANLSANGGATYSWSPATNLSATNIANPVFTAGNTSTYFVTIGNGTCSYVDTVTINVGAVTANAGSDVTICNGTSANLLASGGASYSWTPTTGLSASNIANPTANPTTTTTYIVTSSSGSCSAVDTVVVNVIPSVTANAGADVAICLGSSATLTATGGNSYTWSPSTGLDNANVASPVANPGATTTYAVTVSNGSCSATDSITVSIQTLSVSVNADTAFCAGGSAQLMAMPSNANATFTWTPSTGLNNASIMDPIATPTSTTTYTVVANDGVCSATNSVNITISSPAAPIISTAGSLSVCGNTPVVLNALAAGVIVWTDANGTVLSSNSSYTATANGCYTATVVDANLCSASSFPACVNFNPVPATPTITLANDGSLNSSTVAASYSWTLDGNGISANTQSITPAANGLYTVAAVSDSGCVSTASAPFNYLVTNVTASGVEEFISVYPNPANNFVMVQAQFENSQVMTVTLKDITGRTIESFTNGSASKTMSKEFDLSKQAAGVYFIQFNGNGKSITKKIVKE
jgi:PKD repeat protein